MALGLPEQTLSKWSSMPSDHAILYTTLAACIYCIHKRYGILAFVHVVFLVLLPRVFLGLHWPTDIMAGMLIGALMTVFFMSWLSRSFERRQTAFRAETNPGLFYPIAFFLSFQLTTNFDSVRGFLSGLKDMVLG
jgi:undecaprenyl-diphosphatase